MRRGDKQVAAPTFDTSYGSHKAPLREGKVVYTHPEGRFYTLEFKARSQVSTFERATILRTA